MKCSFCHFFVVDSRPSNFQLAEYAEKCLSSISEALSFILHWLPSKDDFRVHVVFSGGSTGTAAFEVNMRLAVNAA